MSVDAMKKCKKYKKDTSKMVGSRKVAASFFLIAFLLSLLLLFFFFAFSFLMELTNSVFDQRSLSIP